jgi:hypothetical protein
MVTAFVVLPANTALRDFMVNYFSIVKSLDDLFENV